MLAVFGVGTIAAGSGYPEAALVLGATMMAVGVAGIVLALTRLPSPREQYAALIETGGALALHAYKTDGVLWTLCCDDFNNWQREVRAFAAPKYVEHKVALAMTFECSKADSLPGVSAAELNQYPESAVQLALQIQGAVNATRAVLDPKV